MSYELTKSVVLISGKLGLTQGEQNLLIHICSHADVYTLETTVGNKRLAEETGLCSEQVKRSIRKLKNCGFISKKYGVILIHRETIEGYIPHPKKHHTAPNKETTERYILYPKKRGIVSKEKDTYCIQKKEELYPKKRGIVSHNKTINKTINKTERKIYKKKKDFFDVIQQVQEKHNHTFSQSEVEQVFKQRKKIQKPIKTEHGLIRLLGNIAKTMWQYNKDFATVFDVWQGREWVDCNPEYFQKIFITRTLLKQAKPKDENYYGPSGLF